MAYVYPAPPVTVSQDATAYQVHQFMKTPTLISKRLRELVNEKFIADFLLSQRLVAQGGAILYETGEEIYPDDAPEAIAPGAAYPNTVMSEGELAAAKTIKWGRDSSVTDEAISRLLMSPVEKALRKLVNGTVRHVDSVALGVIASKITGTYTGGPWTEASQIIEDVLTAKAKHEEDHVGESYDLNVIVLKPTQYAKVAAKLISDGMLPREAQNPVSTGVFGPYMGLTWTTSTHVPFTDPVLVDNEQLGGMADEKIASPGYTSDDGIGVETKAIRRDETDRYDVRARRVTVPVVLEPNAGLRITGTGV
ncbi:phage major capsid protein [Brevibacterium aurantiacum]|uniref:phage major capsid protein n=1 Tax=Brevibacterium aurantiacum TaxID=273384 RepID=UPI003F93F18C